MFSENELRELAEFSGDGLLLTTVYFQAPKTANKAHRDELIELKELFRAARRAWNGREMPAAAAESLEQDARKILDRLSEAPRTSNGRDMAVFACAARDFFRVIPLPAAQRERTQRVFVDDVFHLRPLTAMLDEHPRHCIVMLDRERAAITEIMFGEVENSSSFKDDVPPRIGATEWGGFAERRIERHANQEAERHFDRVAEALYELFRRYQFDRLVLAGHKETFAQFEDNLHEDLRRRIAGRFAVDPRTASREEVRTKALDALHAHDGEEKNRLVRLALDNAGPDGSAVLGLDRTLAALGKKEVQKLLVGSDFAAGGKRCANCGYLGGVTATDCPQCVAKLRQVDDVVEHAVRLGILENAPVRFIADNEQFRKRGNIGALLRFRSEMRAVS